MAREDAPIGSWHTFVEAQLPDPAGLAGAAVADAVVAPGEKVQGLLLAALPSGEPAAPNTYREALQTPEAREWQAACDAEIASLTEHGVFSWVVRPKDRKTLKSRWVFKAKRNTAGEIVKYKGRVVVKGFLQTPGVDFNTLSLSAPVANINEFRCVIALAAARSWRLHQMDVETAYLNALLEEELFMEAPDGFSKRGAGGREFVWQLHRSLYGLRQSAFNWNATISEFFVEIGFVAACPSPCVFVRRRGSSILIIVLYVDDLLLTGNNEPELQLLKMEIGGRFRVKDLGEAAHLLGMRVSRDDAAGTVRLDQAHYIRDMAARYGMEAANPTRLPADANTTVSATGIEPPRADGTDGPTPDSGDYRSIIGSLMYAACITRLDVAYQVRSLARYATAPTAAHMMAAKRVLRYLIGTPTVGLLYYRQRAAATATATPATATGAESLELVGYSDANLAGCLDSGRSTTSCLFLLAGGVVAFSSRLQHSVARSTMESEYMALFDAAQEAEQLRTLLAHPGLEQTAQTVIHEDNTVALAVAMSAGHARQSRHIRICYHFTRELVAAGVIVVEQVSTADQLADGLTK
ncbi:unnamed protein product, partial [Phaeothamnion confervicola]